MSVSFLAQGTGRKLITGFLLFVFTVSSVMPGYAAGDHLRPPAVKNRKLYSTLQQNLGAMLDGGVLSGEDIVHLKANLGANAVLGVSAAAVRVAAAAHRMPVYQYIAEHLGNRVGQFTNQEYLKALQNIYPEMNIMNGGVHAGWVTDIQEFMILVGMGVEMPFWKRMEIANEVVNALTGIYKDPKALSDILGRKVEKPFSTLVGDEGGYAPELQGNEEAFKLMAAAIERSGYAKEVRIAIDAAISDRYVEKTQSYDLKSEKRILSRQEWITQLKQWFDKYHVAAAEDICAETDHVGWRQAYKAVGGTMTVVGDDLTVTNLDLLKQSIARNAEEINTILIKINQNGSISGTIDVIQFALSHGISVSISHRSGETEDDLISDLAVASNLFEKKAHPVTGKMPVVMLKTGGFRRTDRMVKYNRLLAIESEIEESIRGGNARPAQKVDIGTQTVISGVRAVEVYDSRGNPTVQVVMRLSNGYEAGNTVPSGASTGIRESIELRDGQIAKTDPQRVTQALVNRIMPGMTVERALKELSTRVGGKGVQIAVDNVNHLIAPSIVAARINAAKIDSLQGLKKLDGIMFDLELALAETKKMYSTMNRFFGLTKEQGTALDAKLARVSFDGKENRLGWTPAMFDWIFSPEGRAAVDNVLADADTIKRQYKYVIFCGMGGSGLSVQAVKTIFGENEGVRIYSLRTTDPAVIKDILDQIAGHEGGSLDKALEKTLIIPISKSGTTLETKTHKEYFEKLLSDRKMDIAKHMWVVTDKGSPLDIGVYPQREIQLNGKGDVGGRFTAPTTRVFLAPLSLVAHDKVWPILERTRGMIDGKDKNLSLDSFIAFGRRAYELASKEHKDKLTLILPDALKDFSIWSEQLVEESLGHDGKGVTVVYGEDLSPEVLKSAADNDRFFVRVNIGGKQTRGDLWKYLTDNKYPVQEFNVADTTDIGSLMLGFQMAVATVGYLWDICYVDQPGVEGYKKATRAVQDKLGAGAIVQVPSEWTSGKFRGLNVHYGTLLQAGVLTLAELEAETVRLGGSMSDMPVVYAAALNLLRGKFELAEIASYGRLTPSTRKVFEDARYAIFTRDLQKTSKLGEGPDKNHSYHQNIAQGRDIFNSLYFMPLVMEQPELAYDDNLIRAQTVGTIQSLVDTGRKVVLITSDSTADAAAADLRRFFNRVDIVLRGGADGKDGGLSGISDADLAYKISWLMNDLKSWNMDTYDLAMKKLVLIGAPAVPYLVGALTNTDSRVRARAVSVLWAINDPSAIGQVISLLGNKDERIVESARAVILNYYSAAIPALEAAAKASDPLTRKQIDGLLELIRASSAKDGGIRSVLRDIRNSIMIGLLYADLFNYSDDQLRRDAVVQLGELHDIRTTGLLIEALNDWDASVRRSAADALGDQGDVRAKTALEKRLNDDSPAVRESVKLALRKIDNVSSQETVVRDGGIAGEVKQRVDDIVQTRRVKQLIGQLDGPGVEAAEDELVKIGSSAVDSLKAALWVNRSNDALCVNIIRVLGKIGTHDAMKSLIPLLRNSAKSIRVETVKAVAGFNDPAVINALIFLQRNEYDKEVRQQISAVLAAKGDLKSIDPMAGVAEVTKKPVQGKDGGQKTRIAVIGGATGAIGVPLVQRLRANGEVEVLAGTSRSPDPARNIFSNKDAAAQADIVIVAVPAEYVKSTVRDIVPVMKQGSILLSMGVPMEAVSYKDQDGKDLKKRVYSAPEGFGSAAEEVAAIVKEQQGHGAIHVVAAMHNVPGEWYGDADLELNQQVLVSGDNAIACSVVANQVIKQISKLEPVIVNDLAQSRYSEGLTSAIIASKKELLAEGSRPLTELIDFIRKNGVDVETSSIVAFNREVLDLALVKRYQDLSALERDAETIVNMSVSERQREYVALSVRRYSQIMPEGRLSDKVRAAVAFYDKKPDGKMFKHFSEAGFDTVIDAAKQARDVNGALVIGANAILDNAGSLTALEKVKGSAGGIKIVVWASDSAAAERLETLGIGAVADIVTAAGLKDALVQVTAAQIPANRIVLVNSQGDEDLLRQDFARMAKMFMDYSGIRVVKIKDAAVSAGQSGQVNMMPLAIARAVASILSDRQSVVGEYRKMLFNYKNQNIISESDMATLGDLTESLAEIPLATVDKEIADLQVMYEETLNKI